MKSVRADLATLLRRDVSCIGAPGVVPDILWSYYNLPLIFNRRFFCVILICSTSL